MRARARSCRPIAAHPDRVDLVVRIVDLAIDAARFVERLERGFRVARPDREHAEVGQRIRLVRRAAQPPPGVAEPLERTSRLVELAVVDEHESHVAIGSRNTGAVAGGCREVTRFAEECRGFGQPRLVPGDQPESVQCDDPLVGEAADGSEPNRFLAGESCSRELTEVPVREAGIGPGARLECQVFAFPGGGRDRSEPLER
jgi:hypothetical protein